MRKSMALEKYNKKRDFKKTPEPKGIKGARGNSLRFIVQKHDASHLHYDFRIEMEGVMKSWAVPKGPSLNPGDKRLAMQVEDHPISYNSFEGTIPQGEYGGGEVIVWDKGIYHSTKTQDPTESEKEFLKGLKNGTLSFVLEGEKLRGGFALRRFAGKEKEWILVKKDDEFATEEDITADNSSVLSNRTLVGRNEDPAKYESKIFERIKPMLATLTDKPFNDPDWIYEIKWDGYRAMANIVNGKVDLYSRNFNDFNEKFPTVVEKLSSIKESVILDGEVVAYNEDGNVSFQALQNSKENSEKPHGIEYMIFDILYLEGEDLRAMPLIKRKEILRQFLKKYPELKESDFIEEKGKEFFKLAVEKDLEGIMAKNKTSPYVSNKRTEYWLKMKNHNAEEFVITGFTEPKGSRKNFGALVLAQYDKNKELAFVGHTGTGFDQKGLQKLYAVMLPLTTKSSPFKKKIPLNAPITWIKPKLVAQIKFAERTSDGILRQPVFLGLREDKPPEDVHKEEKVPIEKIKDAPHLTHLEKMYFPKEKITKGDVISYYDKISQYILPYLKGRPESLNRHPNGVEGPNFFQKNFPDKVPDFVETARIHSESNNEYINYLVCQNKETLLYMANLGCIEINPWNSRIDALEYPDYMIFDLDPKGSTWNNLIKVAKATKEVLDSACEYSYIKTSGKSGLHICVPLGAKYKFEDVRNFSHLVARIVNARLPDITSLERNPAKRKKKIYIDYLQNRIGQTTACAYSLRPTSEATVSTPILWKELKPKLDPKKFNIKTIHARLKKVGDIWKPVIREGVDLKKSMECLEKHLRHEF